MSVGCTRLLLATGAPPDHFFVSRGHSPPIIGGRLIHMLRVTVIFAFARSAMPVLQILVRMGQLASYLSNLQCRRKKRLSGFLVPIWGGRARSITESPIGDSTAA